MTDVIPWELTEVAVVESVIDPEPTVETVSDVEAVPMEPVLQSLPEDDLEVNEPTNPLPTTIEEDLPRLFIPDGLSVEEAPLPPEMQRFAPWTWSPTEVAGVGLTLGAILSALSWLLWSVTQ